jgi:hypothetical protein
MVNKNSWEQKCTGGFNLMVGDERKSPCLHKKGILILRKSERLALINHRFKKGND